MLSKLQLRNKPRRKKTVSWDRDNKDVGIREKYWQKNLDLLSTMHFLEEDNSDFSFAGHDIVLDVGVLCNSEDITLTLTVTTDFFNGMIYPKGLSKNSTCMTEYIQQEASRDHHHHARQGDSPAWCVMSRWLSGQTWGGWLSLTLPLQSQLISIQIRVRVTRQ